MVLVKVTVRVVSCIYNSIRVVFVRESGRYKFYTCVDRCTGNLYSV